MELFNTPLTDTMLEYWHIYIDDYGFVVASAIFILELCILAARKLINTKVLGDAVANFFTLGFFIAINTFLLGTFYITVFYWVYLEYSLIQLDSNLWTVLACIVLADIAYYWEHRFVHRVGFAWATHAVHHSSPHFNISVAYRFGPLDGLMPLPFHLPLAFLGFNPIVIFLAEMIVQLYQTLLHTEVVRKLSKPIEAVMNTPSHHRVHHGTNPEYLDKNYAGIFIIWDKLFGTFEAEKAKVIYGVTTPINTNNPVKIFFFGYKDLFKQMLNADSFTAAMGYFFKPPGWIPDNKQQ